MLLLILTTLTLADENVVYKKKTEIDFEAVDIEGQIKKPPGALVQEKERALFNPLVHIRQSFAMEMTQSINDIQ